MTGGASTSAGSASTDNSTHMNWTPKPSAEQQTDIDRRSKQSSGPSYSDHQVSRKERLTRKYGSGK
jgi:hypothetical protein